VYGRRVVAGSIILGLGLGGFFDGIVLHLVLQWHHMLSEREPVNTVDGLELNTLADGVFHAGTYIFTLLGVLLLWHGLSRGQGHFPARVLFGGLLTGWGLFNLVEGIIDHHILEVHHVRHGSNELLWDLGFLAWGAAMLIAGLALLGSARRRVERR
jgi:uncharacterized membrane protein